jgi:hypothetical protein
MTLDDDIQNAKFVEVAWYSAVDNVGIVLLYVPYMGFKSYIGNGSGFNENMDIRHIAALGVKISYQHACAVFGEDRMASYLEDHKLPSDKIMYDGVEYGESKAV